MFLRRCSVFLTKYPACAKMRNMRLVGQTIKLPDAPMKDGFTFVGWETTVKGEKQVFEVGEEFTVTSAQSFTALWT